MLNFWWSCPLIRLIFNLCHQIMGTVWHRKMTTISSIREWVDKRNHIMSLEKLTMGLQECSSKFRDIWCTWTDFSTSTELQFGFYFLI